MTRLFVASEMARRLKEAPAIAPAMAPSTSVSTFSLKSLFRFLRLHNLETGVIVAWVVWIILRHLQSILGPMRRRSGHWSVQYSAMAAYYLPTLLVFYTANAVYTSDSDIKVLLSLGCSVLLVACARGAVAMRAFTLGDGPLKLENWRLLPWLLYFAWLQWGIIWWDRKLTLSDLYYFLVMCLAPLLYVVLAKPGSRANVLDYETKMFTDYMMHQSRSSSPFFDSGSSAGAAECPLYDGCKYPVLQKKDGQWIDFSQVSKGRDSLALTAADADMCLSYSFCRLLARRYFGFPCPEVGNEQVRDFVLTELLAEDGSRAYNIVKVQLALLHDYFFTNYRSRLTTGLVSVKDGVVLVLCLSVVFILSFAVGSLIAGGLSVAGYSIATGGLAVCIYTAIVQPRFPVLPTYWHPIKNVVLHYSRESEDQSAAAAAPGTGTHQSQEDSCSTCCPPYWRDKLGQYSLMEDYDRRSYWKATIAWCKEHVLSQASYKFIKHHPVEEEDVSVPDIVKRLVAGTIKGINGPPTPTIAAARSLGFDRDNSRDLDYLSWTCRQETLTHTILIWHIATCYCDMTSQPVQPLDQQEQEVRRTQPEGSTSRSLPLQEPSTAYHQAATTLSKYCAYLVAFLPDLLPEHSLTVKVVFQEVLQQTKDRLEQRTHMSVAERMIDEGHHLSADLSALTTFQSGVRLGRELELKLLPNVSRKWKVIADFWAMMILYIASSDKAVAHIEQLAQGGEFVTHIWALLCNAGIMKQPVEGLTPSTGN